MVVELGMITPPVGMTLFVILALAKNIPTCSVFRGTIPFIVAEIGRVSLIVAFPATSDRLVELIALVCSPETIPIRSSHSGHFQTRLRQMREWIRI
jgi:hypothetical protein